MRITLDALLVVDAIHRKGSFGGAAAELHRVPSAISYAVQKLEQDLDVTLFDRGGHRAVLTPAGEKLLQDGRSLLRAARALEASVKRVATGWEAELRIAVGELVPMAWLYPVLDDFYREDCGTQLRLASEVLSGTWDALSSGRADLVVGASHEGPAGGGYATRLIGTVEFVFAVAPHHPLAAAPEPLREDDLLRHRAVAVADSSRHLPARTFLLLTGQDVLTVPTMEAKRQAQLSGLGVGAMPRHLIQEDLLAGRLIAKRLEAPIHQPPIHVAWRRGETGRALKWFLQRLDDPALFEGLGPYRPGDYHLANSMTTPPPP